MFTVCEIQLRWKNTAVKQWPAAQGDCTLKPTIDYHSKNLTIFKGKTKRMLPVSYKDDSNFWFPGTVF
jgi:hypothetical protein